MTFSFSESRDGAMGCLWVHRPPHLKTGEEFVGTLTCRRSRLFFEVIDLPKLSITGLFTVNSLFSPPFWTKRFTKLDHALKAIVLMISRIKVIH